MRSLQVMNYKWKLISFLCGGILFSITANAQRILLEAEAIDAALKNSAAMQVSDLQIMESKYLQKSAFNIPNVDIVAESPTGTFFPVGVLQTLDFPTVYFKQNQLQKQQTILSEKGKAITQQDVKRLIRQLYLTLQFAKALKDQLQVQDSLYREVSESAKRQFDAGQIDYLAKTFAESQYGEVHNQFIQVQTDYGVTLRQLQTYTGLKESFTALPIARIELSPTDASVYGLPSDLYLENLSYKYSLQLKEVSLKALSVQRNKALPGLVLGYLNQGPRETETFYKFRVGIKAPIWFWQYSGNINAARTGVAIAEKQAKAQQQFLTTEMELAVGNIQKYNESLKYYETSGLKQTDDIINTAKRFFESGQTDYINYLRNTNEAYLIKSRYLETLRNYNLSIITINYLTGKL
jgi:cobalt-zinc-cadmium efflux system outer membrane protein